MSRIRVFNPTRASTSTTTIECMLQYGDALAMGRGTRDFMQALLSDIGVQASVTNWAMQVYRCNYYCDYHAGEHWQDDWPLVWKTTIQVAEPVSTLPVLTYPTLGSEAFDPTARTTPLPDDQALIGCLVVSDYDSPAERTAARQAISAALANGTLQHLREHHRADLPVFHECVILGRYQQLQIDLGQFPGAWYAQGAEYAQAVIEMCQELHGTTNFLDRVD